MTSRRRISSGLPYELILGYSRALRIDNMVFVSGTTPNWPNGRINPDPVAQTERCFEIIEMALMEAGATLNDVVRTRIYLTDARNAPAIEKVHSRIFSDILPVNTTVVVAGLLNPDWKVEVEVDAIVGNLDREPSKN